MTDEKRAKVVELVRAMLAQAASTTFEAEAETFEAHALRLMAEYEIEQRELRDVDTDYDVHDIACERFGRAQYAAVVLCAEVAKLFGGYGILVRDNRRYTTRLVVTDTQFELAKPLIDHLLAQMMSALNHDKPRSRKDYSLGWVYRVLDRLNAAQAVVYSESNALVPTNDAAKAAYVELHGRPDTGRKIVVGANYQDGQVAGEGADLNQTRLQHRNP